MITDTTAPALPEALDAALRRMRLPYLRQAAPDVLATARAQRWDLAEVVRVLFRRRPRAATRPPAPAAANCSTSLRREDVPSLAGVRFVHPAA